VLTSVLPTRFGKSLRLSCFLLTLYSPSAHPFLLRDCLADD
jgi:hypothetical protein